MLETGARASELVQLRIEDVSLAERVITIRHGKGDKRREVPIRRDLAKLLQLHTGTRRAGPLFARRQQGSGAVLHTLTRQRVGQVVRGVAHAAVITKRVYYHLLWPTVATRLLALGMDITDLQRFLGHESLTTTRLYAETTAATFQRSFDRITDPAAHALITGIRQERGDDAAPIAADLLARRRPPVEPLRRSLWLASAHVSPTQLNAYRLRRCEHPILPDALQSGGRDRLNIHGAIDLETGQTVMKDVLMVDAMSTIMLLTAIKAMYPGMRLVQVFVDNARYHHVKLAQAWLARAGCRIKLHFVPAYCPHLNSIDRLWGLMHRHTTHSKCYATFREFITAMLAFLRKEVPKKWVDYYDEVTDNFRVISPTEFWIIA